MQTREYRTVDKSEWPRGEWDSEPDKVQWQDEATGLPCLIVRGLAGALCGYVGVSDSHPAYKKHYDSVDVDVHGGLTFSDMCANTMDESKHICHVPDPGEPDHVWWLGFDCHHCDDMAPSYAGRYGFHHEETYKSISYVRNQVTRLARQLAAMATV